MTTAEKLFNTKGEITHRELKNSRYQELVAKADSLRNQLSQNENICLDLNELLSVLEECNDIEKAGVYCDGFYCGFHTARELQLNSPRSDVSQSH